MKFESFDVLKRMDNSLVEIPVYCIGWLHFTLTTFIAFSIIIGIMMLDDVHDWEWLTIPMAFIYTNFIECMGHKGPMHHPKLMTKYNFNITYPNICSIFT